MLNLNFPRVSAIAIAIATLSTGSAMAAENLYGGGATFPAQPYVGNTYTGVTPNARLSTNAGNTAGSGFTTATLGTGSVFLTYSNSSTNKVSYCQTGSGFGKNTVAGSTAANQACQDFSVSPLGLSGAAAAPDFIGTDAPYSTADYNAFLGGGNAANRVGIVQVPTLAGAIALPQSTPTVSFNLSAAQVCQIYSGLVSDWSSVSGSGTTGPIKIVYRTDGSGTTFAFTSYLARTCNGTSNVPSGFVFSPNQTFNSALPGGTSGVYGSRAIGASGNNGVVTSVRVTNSNALGYADVGEVLLQSARYVTVAGFDPKNFGKDSSGNPAPVTLAASALLSGRVLDGATVNAVPGSGTTAVKNCVRLVNPTTAITNAYPIAAITYLAGFTSGNGSAAHVQAVKDLFNIFYNTSTRPALPDGFAYLGGVTASAQNTVNTCVQ
ncbi:substrate-binding domain-containing protein [Xanthomonas bonasiae]|uniref:substrate-binding domain-containing protein n=1 Tax=Xanthomonas bonasiae TaxID=2810351 RepID=UPI00197F636C|nr:substrate-binding domain-containing protein [Xanthomonas bonasiae]